MGRMLVTRGKCAGETSRVAQVTLQRNSLGPLWIYLFLGAEVQCSAQQQEQPSPSALFIKGERLKMISLLLCVGDAIAPLGLGLPWEANALWQT